VAFVLSLVGCGEGTHEAPSGASSPSGTSKDQHLISCDGASLGWPAAAMDGGIDSRFDQGELRAALESLAKEAGTDAPTALRDAAIEHAPWKVLAESADTVVVATGTWDANGPGKDGQVVKLEKAEKAGGGWRAVTYGDCANLRPLISPGHAWVEVSASGELDRSSTQLMVGVSEVECSGGRDPRPFLREPTIVADDHSVTISWTTEAPTGANTCVGTMPVPQLIHLPDPLGDRVLLDGSVWPARAVDGSR
jgi:hypothetical protein